MYYRFAIIQHMLWAINDVRICLSLRDIGVAGRFSCLGSGIICAISNKERRRGMREMWVTVGAMVVGYLMYLGIKSMGRK